MCLLYLLYVVLQEAIEADIRCYREVSSNPVYAATTVFRGPIKKVDAMHA